MKDLMKMVRLLLGAADAEMRLAPVADEFVPQIVEARTKLASMRATDLMGAVIALERSGLTRAIDVKTRNPFIETKEKERRPGDLHPRR